MAQKTFKTENKLGNFTFKVNGLLFADTSKTGKKVGIATLLAYYKDESMFTVKNLEIVDAGKGRFFSLPSHKGKDGEYENTVVLGKDFYEALKTMANDIPAEN